MSIGDQQAFPIALLDDDDALGMTYRQWLIGMALNGSITENSASSTVEEAAESAILYADAIIEALDKESRPRQPTRESGDADYSITPGWRQRDARPG